MGALVVVGVLAAIAGLGTGLVLIGRVVRQRGPRPMLIYLVILGSLGLVLGVLGLVLGWLGLT